MLRRLTRFLPGGEDLESTIMVGPLKRGATANDPCEDCGATPADVLVELRYLCPSCARIERAALEGAAGSSGSSGSSDSSGSSGGV